MEKNENLTLRECLLGDRAFYRHVLMVVLPVAVLFYTSLVPYSMVPSAQAFASMSWAATEATTRSRLRGTGSSDTKHLSRRRAGRNQVGGRLQSRCPLHANAPVAPIPSAAWRDASA